MSSYPPNVRSLQHGEFEAGSRVLAASFAEESVFEYLLGSDPTTRASLLQGLMRGMVRGHAPYSEVDGAFIDERLVGIAITIRPEHFPLKPKTLLSIAARTLPAGLRVAVTNRGILRLFQVASVMEKHHPKEPCYYMAFFGVDPTSRQGGVARELARVILARADARQAGCYLDTAGYRTMRMCRRLGFEVRHELNPLKNGPTCWGMWRNPR